jgi:hypothetical protein
MPVSNAKAARHTVCVKKCTEKTPHLMLDQQSSCIAAKGAHA